MIQKMILLCVSIFFVLAVSMLFLPKGSPVSSYTCLTEPKKRFMQDQKMMVVEAHGDPQKMSAQAVKMLFAMYFKIPGAPKGPKQPMPRVRRPAASDDATTPWTALYALPIPQRIEQLPEISQEEGLSISIATWKYGEVAEILHRGPYSEETATIDKLKNYINEQGDSIIADNEEEYIKGPTMFSQGDPKKYCTIIRYCVTKKQP
ncbi:MAG TPA: hypothetical protein VF335_09920 [Chitinivibrionales bacterium]